jgi:predicted ABC-type ATPase
LRGAYAEFRSRVAKPLRSLPRCIIIAGPNGAGKTTFVREFLAKEAGVMHFVNPDLIASGLSPLRPEIAAFAAGRLFLRELDRLARAKRTLHSRVPSAGSATSPD